MSSLTSRSRVALSLALLAAAAVAAACADRTDTTSPRAAPSAPSRSINSLPPVTIDDFYFTPDTVIGGRQAFGVIRFHVPVPSTGGTVVISSSSRTTAWAIPDSVFNVAAGTTELRFLVQTDTTWDWTSAFFTAKQGDYWVPNLKSLTIQPTPGVGVLPSGVTFPSVMAGTRSAAQSIAVRNTSSMPVTIGTPVVSAQFGMRNYNCPATLAAGYQCIIEVWYAPTSAGTHTGTLTIPSSAPNSPSVVTLNGTAYPTVPGISVTPTSLGFGSVALGLATSGRNVKITSTGTGPLTISSVSLGGTNPGDFGLWDNGCSGATLAPGTSCTVSVSFEPNRVGTRTATLTIAHNAAGGSSVVSLSGAGVKGSGGYIP